MKHIGRGLSPSMVVACLALLVALGGASFAATNALAPNSVGTKQLRKNAVTSLKISKNAINGAKVANNSLTGADILESKLGKVPAAGKADSATNATNATNATQASNATQAINATHANNADQLGGVGSAGYARSTLSSGQRESGVYAVAGSAPSDHMVEGVQFAIPLAAPLDASHVEYRTLGTTSAKCPGVGQATAGDLCVYESDFSNRTVVSDSVSNHLINAGADAYGFMIWLFAASADGWSTGSWTVQGP